MKKLLSVLLAVVIAIAGFAFPVSASDSDSVEYTTITADMISAEGATIEYDSYLSSYKITPEAAGQQVVVRLTENHYYMAMWLPATAAD
ncbi:MAG: hypothetical protein IJD22_04070, partial [Clostridia bacterium]|nr:hypothetical protein [Clostridia bacterium]